MIYPDDFINKIIQGDCLEVMPYIPDKSIDMILCDLPYGTTACKWDIAIPLEKLWINYGRIIKRGGAIVLFGTEPFSSVLVMSNLKMFKYDWVWHKSKSGSAFTSKYRPQAIHEHILVFGKGKIKYFPIMESGEPYYRQRGTSFINNHGFGLGKTVSETKNDGYRYPKTIQFFQQKWRRQDQLHPTQKPVPLFEYLIRTYTEENAIILDNCIGSGTTAIACINTKRNFIGIEKEEKYCDIARNRIQDVL